MDKKSVRPLEELLDSVRDIDGFPIGKDEDILALSDPPFYTACPNPYIKEFIEEYGKPYDPDNDEYERTPFVGDVSEGKNDDIYRIHSFHTKVPPKAIIRYIEHYTEPGDIVFDGFCGSGMTGIAAKLTNRKAILTDISPFASYLSYNYCNFFNKANIVKVGYEIIRNLENDYSYLFKYDGHKFQFIIYSEKVICPYCGNDFLFWDAIVDLANKKFKDDFICPMCNGKIIQKNAEKIRDEYNKAKLFPILIGFKSSNKVVLREIANSDPSPFIDDISPNWYPQDKMLFVGEHWGEMYVVTHHTGISRISDFFTNRNLIALSSLWNKITNIKNVEVKNFLSFIFTSILQRSSLLNRLRPSLSGDPMTGTLYIASLIREENVFELYKRKLKSIEKTIYKYKRSDDHNQIFVQTGSSTNLSNFPSNSIDYIFIDPPFGRNLMYSELNFIYEGWLRVFTNNKDEAIKSSAQNKDSDSYANLITNCFREMYRILKPNRWITIEFHNSEARIWNAIQSALSKSNFIIAQVAVLDKKQRSYKQVVEVGSVKNDLIINAYKPKTEFSERFLKNAGDSMEVDFVAQQLEHLPVRPNIERTEKMLYSKMLAHYVENGFKIKYDSTNFYKLLTENFTELDGYWFLDSQVKEYNDWKSGLSLDQTKEVLGGQQVLFVSDEKSAITWMYNFLHTPRDYSEIYTAYQQVATITEDVVPEPRELLDNNFILENGKYRRPVSREEKEEINKNRDRELERAFNKLLKHAKEQKGKIRDVRQEALVHGFTKCYQEGRYRDILTVADRLYASTLESSGDIMDFVDIARIKTAGEKEAGNKN